MLRMDKARLTFGCFLALVFALAMGCSAVAGEGLFDWSKYDFGGETVSIINWTGVPGQFRETGSQAGRLEEAGRLFNCKVEYVQVNEADLAEFLLSRYMAGDSQYDIWQPLFMKCYWPLVTKDVLLSIDDLNLSGYYEAASPLMKGNAAATAYKGKRYLVSGETNSPPMAAKTNRDFYYIYYNKTMLEEAGCEDPYDLFKRGEWNWDNFSEMLRKVTKDLDGDGQTDQWGINACIYSGHSVMWVYANGGKEAVFDEKGKLVFAENDEAARYATEQLFLWNTVDKVMHNTGTTDQHFADGIVCFHSTDAWNYTSSRIKNTSFEMGIVPFPQGPHADEMVVLGQVGGCVLPANAADPEALLALYEFLMRGDNETIAASAESNDSIWRTREDYDVATWMMENYMGVCPRLLTGHSEILSQYNAMRRDIAQGMSFSQAVNQYESVIQALIDDLYGQ